MVGDPPPYYWMNPCPHQQSYYGSPDVAGLEAKVAELTEAVAALTRTVEVLSLLVRPPGPAPVAVQPWWEWVPPGPVTCQVTTNAKPGEVVWMNVPEPPPGMRYTSGYMVPVERSDAQ